MDLEGFLAKLLRTAIAGAMLVNGVAWAADDCAGTTPCFSKVNDYLNGKRFLLPNQDLGYLTAREPDHGFPYSLFNLELSKDLKFTSSEQKLEPAAKCALLRGPYGARLFNTVNDWVVGMKGQPAADDLCSLDGLNSGLLTVQDPLNPQTMQTQPIVAASGGAAQFEITIGDVNQDGYDDIVVSKGDGIDIFTAVDVNNPSKGLRKAASFGIEDLPKYESITDYPHGSVAIGDFNHDGATDLITSYISETATEHAAFVPFYAMYAYSICPAVGFVLYSGSTDPAFQPYTCKAAFEIFKWKRQNRSSCFWPGGRHSQKRHGSPKARQRRFCRQERRYRRTFC